MKKFFGILAIAGVLVACDNAATSTENKDSIEKARLDSLKQDSINKAAAAAPAVIDSAAKVIDSAAKVIDSAAKH